MFSHYCHVCFNTTNLDPEDSSCIRCHGGFVEELPSLSGRASHAVIITAPLRITTPRSNRGRPRQSALNLFSRNLSLRGLATDFARRSQEQQPEEEEDFDWTSMLQNLIDSVFTPGEVASESGFRADVDNILRLMLANLENAGPPPAREVDINAIPTVRITHSDVDQKASCCICCEDYTVSMRVSKLPCSHLFHKDCIRNWLQLHGTCPICRESLTRPPVQRPSTSVASASTSGTSSNSYQRELRSQTRRRRNPSTSNEEAPPRKR